MRAAISALFFAASAVASALAQSAVPAVAPAVVHGDAYPRAEVAFPNGVRGLPAIPYWTPNGFRPLTLDLYLPAASTPPPPSGLPLVVYIHGGAWLGGNSHASGAFADFPGVLASLAARGYAVASINYRLSGEARFPAQAWDVKAAIRFLRLHAGEYGIDPARAVAWGVSAGGHLSALADVTCHVPELAPRQTTGANHPEAAPDEIVNAEVSDCIQGAIAWYGVFDMATIAEQSRRGGALSRDVASAPEWRLLGCFKTQCQPDQIRLASPVSFVDHNTPPLLLIVGAADTTVPCHQTTEMAARMRAAGAKYKLIVMPGVSHVLMGKTPDQTQDANLQALAATFRFIDQTIGPAARRKAKADE